MKIKNSVSVYFQLWPNLHMYMDHCEITGDRRPAEDVHANWVSTDWKESLHQT